MFVCYYVFKACVIENMFFCLTQKPHPRFWGWGCVPQERENQINTLVLKDINFTINIIELSYYRTIDTLNQSNKCSRGIEADTKESLPKPLQRRGCSYCIQFEITIYMSGLRDIPSFGGAWGGIVCGTYPN